MFRGFRHKGGAGVDGVQHALPHGDECRIGADGAGVLPGRETPGERQLYRLDDAAWARAHDDQAGGEEDRFFHVVGDEEGDLAGPVPYAQDQFLHLPAGERIKGAQRLVHQQHPGVAGQGAGDAHALLHSARQLVNLPLRHVGQADEA